MIRKGILTLGILALASAGYAQSNQPCATDEFFREQKARNPQIAVEEARLNAYIEQYINGRFNNAKAKATHHDGTPSWEDDVEQLHIPVVVHVVTDYAAGVPYISDNEIFGMIDRLNNYFNVKNPDINGIIPVWKPYIGNARISFHLATKDPAGKATRGITRHYSHHAQGGDELAKIGTWAPDQYLNIYLENVVGRTQPGGTVLAYATFPESYNENPYSQGVIARADQALFSNTANHSTLAHEVGHFLRLYHTWNSSGQAANSPACGDDEVDDTPPTTGHDGCNTAKLYDTTCAKGYVRNYDAETAYHRFKDSSASSLRKDYPDTVNTQNIMDYSFCANQMFTKGQVARMRAALRSPVGYRASLSNKSNLIRTGVWDTLNNVAIVPQDIAPTAEFSVNRNFICADGISNVTFTNRSYNDTASVSWSFDKGATVGASSDNVVQNSFREWGWVNTSLTATSNAGSNTISRNDLVYAADPVAKEPMGYYQEWNPNNDLDRFPIFNYFKTTRRWEVVSNAGFYDNTSIRYSNYDTRTNLNFNNLNESPRGDYADFYTPAFNLSGFGSKCFVSFYSAGAFRTNKPSEMNDKLEIAVSNDCGQTWRVLDSLKGGDIGNNGYRNDNFTPSWIGEWKEQSINIPATITRGDQTFFRFRYRAGVVNPSLAYLGIPYFGFGTGNNFYMDRITITNAPLDVKNGIIVNLGMSVTPNPTNGAATVTLNGGDNSQAEITVTDVTGKLVYSSTALRNATKTQVEIPASVLAVKGMYLVKVVTNGATETKKLVVY